MAVNLKKGQGISLKKDVYGLSKVTIGLGWNISSSKSNSNSSDVSQDDYDLDVVAFLCESDGKVHNLGKPENGRSTLVDGDVIFFNSMRHYSGDIWLTGDSRTGGENQEDDEQIIVNLEHLPDKFEKIVFVVQIYKGILRKQSFDKVENAFIRAVDQRGNEMIRFSLSYEEAFINAYSMLFAELKRDNNGWKFDAIGMPNPSDSFVAILKQYL